MIQPLYITNWVTISGESNVKSQNRSIGFLRLRLWYPIQTSSLTVCHLWQNVSSKAHPRQGRLLMVLNS